MARIKVAVKRNSNPAATDIITYKGLVINFAARDVTIDGKRVQMTPKEYDILFYLARNMNIAMSREKLLEEVWGYEGYYGDIRNVDVTVCRLRNKIEADPSKPEYLMTKRGIGYYLRKP